MKKLIWLMVVVMAGIIAAYGCKKEAKGPEGEVVIEEEIIIKGAPAPDVISKSLSTALCKRMVECAPGTVTEEDCTNETNSSLTEALREKPLSISKAQLETCVSSINAGTCEEVMGTEPPKGCEFLE